MTLRLCSVEGCGRKARYRDVCRNHYQAPEHPTLVPVENVAHARRRDPVPSVEAARRVRVSDVQEKIFLLLAAGGSMTDEDLIRRFRQMWPERRVTDQNIRSRRAELRRNGLVEAANDFGETETGNRAMKWRVVQSMEVSM